ncbi:MAG: hypothetical protein SCARUB_01896 [Candidatus Scalindua rubra]|uniref:CarS SH3 domain-containing protein n=1 Tax=Candidatus Scalindua rubra TaxID=1872076 RepID=A0A1E3XBC3_9BACT|nr:MAG: hypothetical protein SCARUB_01896 [Candidatus Scalindua rubra]
METKKLDRLITKLLNPNYTFKNIKGAPFKISDKVLVLDNPNNDNSFNNEFVGKKGHVFYFEYDCGCGQTFPSDPLIGVKFINKKVGEYWKEEIQLLD